MATLLSKPELRAKMRKALSLISPEFKEENSQRILVFFLKWLEQNPEVQKIGLYSALPSEVDLSSAMQLRPGLEWYFPLVKNSEEMTFHRVNDQTTLAAGFLGISEPNPLVHPPIKANSLDLILCPGLGFTTTGSRLGRGGGFFDRYLEACQKTTIFMGVGFSLQLEEFFPTETHDIPMHYLLNESGVTQVQNESKS